MSGRRWWSPGRCAPHKLVWYTPKQEELDKDHDHWPKIPSRWSSRKPLRKHAKYMRLHTNEQLIDMTLSDLQASATTFQHPIEPRSTKNELQSQVKKLEDTRSLIRHCLELGIYQWPVHVAWGMHDTNKLKPDLQEDLHDILSSSACTNLAALQSHPTTTSAKLGGVHSPWLRATVRFERPSW